MRAAKQIRPQYAQHFHCIASECEDSCCDGWTVSIDKETYKKYRHIPDSPLRVQLDENLLRSPRNADGSAPEIYATMRVLPSKRCPMHNEEDLCQIQVELGEQYLSELCASFPRATVNIDNCNETTLSLSCPEAARIVLQSRNLLGAVDQQTLTTLWDDRPGVLSMPLNYFWPIREFTVSLLLNRDYPLWQRLFLLGTFSRRLEAVIRDAPQGDFPALESGFTQAIATGSLRASIDTIPVNIPLQLDLVLELARKKSGIGNFRPRLDECWKSFLDGIGGEALPFDKQCAAYSADYADVYAPFFLKHPQMLENLLLNMVFRSLYPFGREGFERPEAIEPTRIYALLVTEFALIKGILIGVAGCRKDAFSPGDVVQTVQVITKHFQHNPRFVAVCLEMLAAKGLNNAHGLTMLLRN